jgi:hypothetical protein
VNSPVGGGVGGAGGAGGLAAGGGALRSSACG